MPPVLLVVALVLSAPPERFLFETEADCRYAGGRPWVLARYDLLAPNTPPAIVADADVLLDGLADRFNANLRGADRQRKLYVARRLTAADPPPADPFVPVKPRTPYDLKPLPPPADPHPLAGVRADGELLGRKVLLDFHPGGRLAVRGQATADGTWTQDARGVTFTTGAAAYRGVLVGSFLIGRRFPTDPTDAPTDWHLDVGLPGGLPAEAEAFVGRWAAPGKPSTYHFHRDGTVFVQGEIGGRFILTESSFRWKYEGPGRFEAAYPKDIPTAAGLPADRPIRFNFTAPRILLYDGSDTKSQFGRVVGLLRFDTGAELLVEQKTYSSKWLGSDSEPYLPLLKRPAP